MHCMHPACLGVIITRVSGADSGSCFPILRKAKERCLENAIALELTARSIYWIIHRLCTSICFKDAATWQHTPIESRRDRETKDDKKWQKWQNTQLQNVAQSRSWVEQRWDSRVCITTWTPPGPGVRESCREWLRLVDEKDKAGEKKNKHCKHLDMTFLYLEPLGATWSYRVRTIRTKVDTGLGIGSKCSMSRLINCSRALRLSIV